MSWHIKHASDQRSKMGMVRLGQGLKGQEGTPPVPSQPIHYSLPTCVLHAGLLTRKECITI